MAQAARKPVALTEVDSFLAIDKVGNVTVYSGKVDLGTGVTTALRQIVAEELDVPIGRIELIQGDTLLTPDQGNTWGSLTIQLGGMQLRQASAAARQALMVEAAKKLGADQLTVADGVISGGGKNVELRRVDRRQELRDHARSQTAGEGKRRRRTTRSSARRNRGSTSPHKITGRFTYMQDFKVPGMLHGRVVRPPAIGAKLESVDDSARQEHSRDRQGGARGRFPRCCRVQRMGRNPRRGAPSRPPGRSRKRCPIRPSSGITCGPPRWSRTRSPAMTGNTAEAMRQGRGQGHQGDLRLRHPHPRLDRAVLRDCRIQ